MESFRDELVGPGVTDLPERFFDRFVFNLHRTDATTPSIIFGAGIHPVRDTVDGFAILTTSTEQRNVRFVTELSTAGWSSSNRWISPVLSRSPAWARAELSSSCTVVTLIASYSTELTR